MTAAAMHPSDDFDPAEYGAAGISPDVAVDWWKWRIDARTARAWTDAGIGDPLTASQWTTAHVGPQTVADWQRAGITASEAISWHEFGFDLDVAARRHAEGHTPDQAYDLSRGRTPRTATDDDVAPGDAFSSLMSFAGDPQDKTQRFISKAGASDGMVMYSYINQEWLDDEAIAWASHNIDAATAQTWKDLGLRPAEAGSFIRRGMSPMAVARAWWQAGLPFAETASWIGAGLTPEEAAEQRSRGVTAEQAETLRTLRFGQAYDD